MDTIGVIQLVIILILVFLSAFFSSAETALTTVNKVRMKALVAEENKSAMMVMKILDNHNKMLSTILIGNNIVNIVASALTTILATQTWGNYAVGYGTGILTMVVLLFGEIIPKTWAMLNADKICLIYGRIIYALMTILTPVIIVVNKLSYGIMFLLHIDPNKRAALMTENELKTYVDVSHEDGVIESEEREMIYNLFDFSDAVAKDIMLPRVNMITLNAAATYDDVLDTFKECMYTRIPVYQEDKDNIIGVINIKDLICIQDKDKFSITDILRPAYFTYEYKKSADLMLELRENTTSVAFVLNEYGLTTGMITMEDLLEEIVGEIRDEYDQDEEEYVQKIDEFNYLIEGSMKLDDLNHVLEVELYSADYDSIGGIVIEYLDRLPKEEEMITLASGIIVQVKEMDQNRISKVLLTIPPKVEEDQVEDEQIENGD